MFLLKDADVSSKRCSCFLQKMLMLYRNSARIFQKKILRAPVFPKKFQEAQRIMKASFNGLWYKIFCRIRHYQRGA